MTDCRPAARPPPPLLIVAPEEEGGGRLRLTRWHEMAAGIAAGPQQPCGKHGCTHAIKSQ